MFNEIPEMTDPLGKHWNQPKDIRLAPMDDKHVILKARHIDELNDYSQSMPSGVYPGKAWLWIGPKKFGARMFLCWFGEFTDETKTAVHNHNREILIVD